jgi:hypothetical protein
MSNKPRLDRARALAEAHPELQQFGQSNDDDVWNGKTACTHTVCQFLMLVWHGKKLTLNDVNTMAGMPKNATNSFGKPRGMVAPELRAFLKAADIPMVIKYGLPFEKLLSFSDRGPVFYGMRYGSAPRCKRPGVSPKPNGFALAFDGAGTTQKGIDDIRHAVVMLGYLNHRDAAGTVTRTDVFRKEPNHGSPARPERPPYDQISAGQAKREYVDYHAVLGNKLYAAVPIRELQVSQEATDMPGLRVVDLKPLGGFAVIRGNDHAAIQLADRERIKLPANDCKQIIAEGRLDPPLDNVPGDRSSVVLVGNEAAVLLKSDIEILPECPPHLGPN